MIAAGRISAPKKIRCFTGYAACWLLGLAGLVVALVLGTLSYTNHSSKKVASKEKAIWREHVAAGKPGKGRKTYPLSVINGGAYSAEELNRARRLDPVVKAHYANFGENPVVQQTSADLFMYVSYRKSDAVYWTRTKRRIPKGEFLLTDGKNLARARCGNRLSFTPQQPASPEKELPDEALNTPETPKVSIPFDALPLPATEADLYVPTGPMLTDLLFPLLPPSPFAASHPLSLASPGAGGAYSPGSAWGTGSLPGGAPFFWGERGFPSRINAASTSAPGASVAVPIIIGIPEPVTAKLLLLAILILALFSMRGRIHSRR